MINIDFIPDERIEDYIQYYSQFEDNMHIEGIKSLRLRARPIKLEKLGITNTSLDNQP